MGIENLLNSHAASTLIGLLSGFVGFFANEWIHQRRRKLERREKYVAEVFAARAEVNFYVKKLQQISADATAIIEQIKNLPGLLLVPSFKVHPEHIGKLKIGICGETKNQELATSMIECHYDLAHISEKLESLSQGKSPEYVVLNAKQLSRLADSSAKRFELTASLLETEANRIQ